MIQNSTIVSAWCVRGLNKGTRFQKHFVNSLLYFFQVDFDDEDTSTEEGDGVTRRASLLTDEESNDDLDLGNELDRNYN